MKTDEPKEGDEVVLREKVASLSHNPGAVYISVPNGEGEIIVILVGDETQTLRKVRPGTYEVTARDVAKMMRRAASQWFIGSLLHPHKEHDSQRFKTLKRWVHCRLRELRRKRGGR